MTSISEFSFFQLEDASYQDKLYRFTVVGHFAASIIRWNDNPFRILRITVMDTVGGCELRTVKYWMGGWARTGGTPKERRTNNPLELLDPFRDLLGLVLNVSSLSLSLHIYRYASAITFSTVS